MKIFNSTYNNAADHLDKARREFENLHPSDKESYKTVRRYINTAIESLRLQHKALEDKHNEDQTR